MKKTVTFQSAFGIRDLLQIAGDGIVWQAVASAGRYIKSGEVWQVVAGAGRLIDNRYLYKDKVVTAGNN